MPVKGFLPAFIVYANKSHLYRHVSRDANKGYPHSRFPTPIITLSSIVTKLAFRWRVVNFGCFLVLFGVEFRHLAHLKGSQMKTCSWRLRLFHMNDIIHIFGSILCYLTPFPNVRRCILTPKIFISNTRPSASCCG